MITKALSLSLALVLLGTTVQPASAQYAAIIAKGGSPNVDTDGAKVVGRLRYELERETSVGDSLLSFSAGGLLSFGDDTEGPNRTHAVQEAFVSYQASRVEFSLGRQLVLWGVADGFNPTDVVTPFNFQLTSFGSRDARFGVDGVTLDAALTDSLSLSALAIFDKPTDLLSRGFDPTGTFDPDAPFRTGDTGYGARLNWQSSLGDFYLSAYQGPSNQGVIVPSGTGTAVAAPEITMVGLDFDTVVGPWRLYTEAAVHTYSGGHASIAPQFLPDDEFQGVFGAEYELTGSNRLGLQVFYRDLLTNRPTGSGVGALLSNASREIFGQYGTRQTGTSISYSWESPSTRWSADATVATWFEGDVFARLRGKFRIDDQQSLYLYGDWFDGPSGSPFGELRDTSSISLEYRYFF